MPYPQTLTASAMREINRSAILEIIRRESPISRTTIAERLDVSLPTVVRVVDELVEDGLVRLHGGTEWSGGRRGTLLEFNVDGHVVLGVDMGGGRIYGALSNLGGNFIDELSLDRCGAQGEESFTALTGLIDALLASPRLESRPVWGIGIGVPGITLHKEGIVRWSHSLNWKDFPLKARLAERYQLPITVENGVNLAALGELWFGAGKNCQNMVVVATGAGIRAGIIIDGVLYRGANEASGEIGNLLPGPKFLRKNFLESGVLESVASGASIVARARQVLQSRRSPADLENLLVEDVFEASRQGQEWACRLIEETADYLAVAVADLAACFDPEVIVLGGEISRFAEFLAGPILQRINGTIPILPGLVASTLGPRARVLGAITAVFNNNANLYLVHRRS